MRAGWLFALWLAAMSSASAAEHVLRVETNFPGGSAQVHEIDQQARRVRFQVPAFAQGGLRSWWYFKVTGVKPGETLTLELVNWKTRAQRAAFSLDQKEWRFTARVEGDENAESLVYRQRVDGPAAWFAWYVPYLPADAEALVRQAERDSPHARKFELCASEGGRPVWGLRVAEPGAKDEDRFGLWLQARQHAWETGGSWTAHGLAQWLISADERAVALRQRAQIFVVPIMDVDSVAAGAGGKWQDPHDHNRDWSERPYWRAVQAAMARCQELDRAGRLDLFLDLHDPGWAGEFEFWCNPYPVMRGLRRANTDRFLACCKTEITGPLKFVDEVYSPYPLDTPTAGNWSSQRTRASVVGGTCEIGVGPPDDFAGQPPEHHLRAGQQLGLALERYFRASPRAQE